MSAAIDYIHAHGLLARANGDRLFISPASKLTQGVRQYITSHRLELLEELASNDWEDRRRYWRVILPNGISFTMIGAPCMHFEALAHAQGIWSDAEVW